MDGPYLAKFFLISLTPIKLTKGLILNIVRTKLVGGVANGENTVMFDSFGLVFGISKEVRIWGLDA
jgi:hypothetical protein